MKKSLLALLLLLTLTPSARADVPDNPARAWEIAPEIYYVNYEEPGLMQNEGVMAGASAELTLRPRAPFAIRFEGRAAAGLVDYSSANTGSAEDIVDYTFEGRALAAYEHRWKSLLWSPYFGAGYRYLNDDSAATVTTTGHSGYERESHYLYSPLGLDVEGALNAGWSAKLRVEYDIFWEGRQESHLSDVSPAFSDLDNDQSGGHGWRASFDLVKKGERYDFAFGPFVRYWKIDESDLNPVTFAGVLTGYGYEPENETVEAGGRASLRF